MSKVYIGLVTKRSKCGISVKCERGPPDNAGSGGSNNSDGGH